MTLFNRFPTFALGEYYLRELDEDDAEAYFFYMSHARVVEFIPVVHIPTSIEDARTELRYWSSLFRERRGLYWGIARAADNMLIGTAGFNSIIFSQNRAEISYDLAYEHWGKGVMTKALKCIVEFAFKELDILRLQAIALKENERSIRLLRRLHFVYEGTLRKYEKIVGEHKDAVMYARLAS